MTLIKTEITTGANFNITHNKIKITQNYCISAKAITVNLKLNLIFNH